MRMAELVHFIPGKHDADLEEVLTAFIEEGAARLERVFGITQDIPAAVDNVAHHLKQFTPPAGRLLLVVDGEAVLGCGGLRPIAPGVAEIKRMYVRPEVRGRGLGKQLLDALLTAARQQGYREARLDTHGLLPAAPQLYLAAGFTLCEPYPESEIPMELHDRWLFMRRDLTDANPVS
jgi:GNAT superfamily N-acetyltransferase